MNEIVKEYQRDWTLQLLSQTICRVSLFYELDHAWIIKHTYNESGVISNRRKVKWKEFLHLLILHEERTETKEETERF